MKLFAGTSETSAFVHGDSASLSDFALDYQIFQANVNSVSPYGRTRLYFPSFFFILTYIFIIA